MTHNADVLPMAGDSMNLLSERQPNKKLKVQNMNKSPIKNFQPEPQVKSEQQPIVSTSPPAIGNTNVVRRLESCMSKFGEAHNMLARTKLSKEDYQPISSLLSNAKVELFNIYRELKGNQNVQMDKISPMD